MATPALEREIAIVRELRLGKLLYLATTTLGSVYRDQRKDELAIETLARAVGQIEAMRASAAGNEQGRQVFFQHKVPPYHMLIDLLVGRGQTSEALAYAERAKARVLLDSLGRDRAALARAMSSEERREGGRLDRAIIGLNRQVREERLKLES